MTRCTDPSRREFLAATSAAATAAMALAAGAPRLGGLDRAAAAQSRATLPSTADTFILLWMAGGMPHTETFDPKRYAPFEPGMDARDVLSTFPDIATAAPGIRISRGLEHIAGVMDRATLIRSYVAPDLGTARHEPHHHHWQTATTSAGGRHIGAVIADALGPLDPAVPPFIRIGDDDPAVRAREREGAGAVRLSDLPLDDATPSDGYDTGRFGRGCLLTRNLALAGARFVELSTGYVPFGGWDAHADGHAGVARMKEQIDAPVARLVKDLEAAGRLDRTLIVLASEFSRDILPSQTHAVSPHARPSHCLTHTGDYGMHCHFTAAGSVLMFGGGVRRGFLYGKTADERPCAVIESPIHIADLHATIYRAMGIARGRAHGPERILVPGET